MDKKIATLLKGDSTALEQQFFVDYNMSFEEMVKAAKYDSVSYKVNQKLTLLGKGKTFFIPKLFLFDRPISSLEVIQEMEKAGCRPSKNEEFVSFDIMLSEDQRNYPIIGLGSRADFDDSNRVLYLSKLSSIRKLDSRWFGLTWYPGSTFLGIHKTF